MGGATPVHLVFDANVIIAFKQGGHLQELINFLQQEKDYVDLHMSEEILLECGIISKKELEKLSNFHRYTKTQIGSTTVTSTKTGVKRYYKYIHTNKDADYLALAAALKVAEDTNGEECWFCTNDFDLFQGSIRYLPHTSVKNLRIINVPSLIAFIHRLNGLLITPRKATEITFNIFEKDELENIYKRLTAPDVSKRWALSQCQGKFRIYAAGVLSLPALTN